MPKSRKTFLIVPPKKSRVRHIRIHFGVIIIIVILALISIAGYLIPSESINLTSEEIIRKGHLSSENNKLFIKIRKITKMLDILGKELDTLSTTKNRVRVILDTKQKEDSLTTNVKNSVFATRNLDSIITFATNEELFLKKFIVRTNNRPEIATSIPVALPIKKPYSIVAKYGNMHDPFTGGIKWHNGVDFSSKKNAKVIAPASGTVVKIKTDDQWGKRVIIKHKFGYKTVYAHLNSISVKQREKVKRGDTIGTIGSTGLSTGPHLHYEIIHNGKNVDPESLFFISNSAKKMASTK